MDILMPIYANREIILDLYSIIIDGYLESVSIKCVKDKSDNFRVQNGGKNVESNDSKEAYTSKDKISIVEDKCIDKYRDFSGTIDDRNSIRDEISVKRIYTNFHILNKLKDVMVEENMLKYIKKGEISSENIIHGEYIEVDGYISPISPITEINTMIDIIETYDDKELNKLLKNKQDREIFMDYSIILKHLKNLNKQLSAHNTTNMIIDCEYSKVVLNINTNNFSDKNVYMYDNVHCDCKILCKVIRVVDENEHIDLLCKTCMSSYYNELFKSIGTNLDILRENSIIVPNNITTEIKGPAIQAIPIAIYV
ncbi:hypothetical protein K144313037_16280 [Clostridium tetani]|nr:hypothetical protein [Clostridium tetani]AVP55480.1 hypothetical protein C3B72_10115 [Clostridium tetani]KGI37690.1 hypothetical protein KY52_09090 [Clostridium tetani]KGI39616.1 hypothetical protein LA33_02670 [Clostridium tetani ATCC 9441]KGI44939.1 hypothetical protein KY55_03015 [Clostridium tetani]KGI45589.1 hypothetical protein KY54_05660 [Clostridium tetani]